MTLVLVTTCCADKARDPGLIPAARRYRSSRLGIVARRARERGVPWLILSGRFGLLAPGDPLPWYDHLLQETEVAAMVPRVAARLREQGVTAVEMQTAPLERDPLLGPYLAVMRAACDAAGVHWCHVADPSLPD